MSDANDAITGRTRAKQAQQAVIDSIQAVRKQHRIEQGRSAAALHACEDENDALKAHAAISEISMVRKDDLCHRHENDIISLTETIEKLHGKNKDFDANNTDLAAQVKSKETQIEIIPELKSVISNKDKALNCISDKLATVVNDKNKLTEQNVALTTENAILFKNMNTTAASNETAVEALKSNLNNEISLHQLTKDKLKAMQEASIKQDAEKQRIAQDLKNAIRNHTILKTSFQIMSNPDPCAHVDLTMDDTVSTGHLKRKFATMDDSQDPKVELNTRIKGEIA